MWRERGAAKKSREQGASVEARANQLCFQETLYVVFIITDKENLVGDEVKGVGVMKDEDLKVEEIEVSHTLGG
jgi:hypothetical protein